MRAACLSASPSTVLNGQRAPLLQQRSARHMAAGAAGRQQRRQPPLQATLKPDILTATDSTFQDVVLASPVTTLLIFWEEKNNHSAQFAEKVEKLVSDLKYGDQLRAVRVDIEKCPVIAEECLIMDVPAVQIFKGGVEREALRGRVSMAELWDKLKHYMEH